MFLFFLLAGVVAGESCGVLEGVSSRLLLFTARDWGTLASRVSKAMCSSSRRWSPAVTLRTKSTWGGKMRGKKTYRENVFRYSSTPPSIRNLSYEMLKNVCVAVLREQCVLCTGL